MGRSHRDRPDKADRRQLQPGAPRRPPLEHREPAACARRRSLPLPPPNATPRPVPASPISRRPTAASTSNPAIEKSPYALTEAEFSGWLENDDRWNLRLEGPSPAHRPAHQRYRYAASDRARRTRPPLRRYSHRSHGRTCSQAQLGELTKLVLGHDLAWRGSVETQLTARGPLNHLQLASTVRIQRIPPLRCRQRHLRRSARRVQRLPQLRLQPPLARRHRLRTAAGRSGAACASRVGGAPAGVPGFAVDGAGARCPRRTARPHLSQRQAGCGLRSRRLWTS